jgi:hypothetical protein
MLARLARRTIPYGFSVRADVQGDEPVTDGHSGRCLVRYDVRGAAGAPVASAGGSRPHFSAERSCCGGRWPRTGCAFRENRVSACGVPRRRTPVPDARHCQGRDRRGRLRAPSDRDRRGASGGSGRTSPAARAVSTPVHPYAGLLDEFGPALALADVVALTDIYPAGGAIEASHQCACRRCPHVRRCSVPGSTRSRRSRPSRSPAIRGHPRRGVDWRLVSLGALRRRRARHEPLSFRPGLPSTAASRRRPTAFPPSRCSPDDGGACRS